MRHPCGYIKQKLTLMVAITGTGWLCVELQFTEIRKSQNL